MEEMVAAWGVLKMRHGEVQVGLHGGGVVARCW